MNMLNVICLVVLWRSVRLGMRALRHLPEGGDREAQEYLAELKRSSRER